MANTFLRAEQIAAQAMGLLQREIVLPALVWRDAIRDWRGAKNDTVSIRVPAYINARTRALRSGNALVADNLSETKVDVTLDTHVYELLNITDEELTLDISDFGQQVTQPAVQAVSRGIEDALVAEMQGATILASRTIEVDNTNPFDSFVDARKLLNDANVPTAGRVAVVGSSIEARLLKDDQFANADKAGDNNALREARTGRIAGVDVIQSNALLPTEGYMFHRSAFVLGMATPVKPEGATWGATASLNGMTLRVLRDYDPTYAQDRQLVDVFVGTGTTTDAGYFDANGVFFPYTGTIASVTLATSAAADDIIDTATAHGYAAGDRVVFPSLTGGAGLTANRVYYVIAANLAATTFQVSATAGGAAVNFTTDITAGTVSKGGASYATRVVKLTDNS